MTTVPYTPQALASRKVTTVIRCRCGKVNFTVEGTGVANFKCNDRGCAQQNRVPFG